MKKIEAILKTDVSAKTQKVYDYICVGYVDTNGTFIEIGRVFLKPMEAAFLKSSDK